MGQEFIIKSTTLEDKINQLLPSQGGQQAGVDLSASTTIIPIVDLTESAEGSNLRQDLQLALSLTSITATNITNASTTLITTTGYYRVFGTFFSNASATGLFKITDGTTTKQVLHYQGTASYLDNKFFDFVVFLKAGDSFIGESSAAACIIDVVTRQIADINGNLVNPV